MEATETICNISDSINAVTPCIADVSHSLTGYMEEPSQWFDSISPGLESDFVTLFDVGIVSSLLGITVALIMMGGLIFLSGKRNINSPSILTSPKVFITVWLSGFVVYDVGMCTGQYISLLTNAPMAIIYAFKIFVFDSDVSEIHGIFHESWLYSLGFAVVHFMAALISTSFLIRLFGFNFISRIRLWWKSLWFSRSVSETYIFWGLNEATFHLIKSIREHYKKLGSDDYRIVVVNTCKDETDILKKKIEINHIFDFMSVTSKDMYRLQGADCFVVGRSINFSELKVNDKNKDIIKDVLKLKSLQKMLLNHTDNTIHMLFLSDNEKNNLHDISILLNDTSINHFVKDSSSDWHRRVLFYCHTRYNSIHRVIEDQHSNGKIQVNVVDSSHISVEMLKKNKELLPANFVNIKADATVSTSFDSLVVGFSEVGQDSVRFLYEFGAFVKHHPYNSKVERSDFNLHVVDRHMDDLAGPFVAAAPAINISMPFLNKCERDKDYETSSDTSKTTSPITFHKMDCRSVEFFLHLEKWIKSLNYVVLATDDDELNLSLGVRIFKTAVKHRENLKDLCILVRAHNDDDGHLHRVAEHYNRLWLAQSNASSFNGKDHRQTKILRDHPASYPIHIFGLSHETYTYANIIDDTIEKEAICYKELYEASTNQNYEKPTTHRDYAWNKDIADKLDPCDKNGEIHYAPSYSGIMALRRMQSQDIANSMHKITKLILAGKAIEAAGLSNVDWTSLVRKQEKVIYTLQQGNEVNPLLVNILDTLAQTEHLRWNASHQLLGYIQSGIPPQEDEPTYKHEGKLHHSCIVDWDKLSTSIQSYDYNVVDVSLDIINNKRPQKK